MADDPKDLVRRMMAAAEELKAADDNLLTVIAMIAAGRQITVIPHPSFAGNMRPVIMLPERMYERMRELFPAAPSAGPIQTDTLAEAKARAAEIEAARSVYLGEWSSEDEMLNDFGIGKDALEGATVLVAEYDCPPYEGYAVVLFERGGKLYEVEGSHCSCHGLSEDSYMGGGTQWKPEEVSADALLRRISGGGRFGTAEATARVAEAIKPYLATPKALRCAYCKEEIRSPHEELILGEAPFHRYGGCADAWLAYVEAKVQGNE